ncbi:MAG: pseudouridine synthase [Synechococcales bacterium]|nr:pseudouridine synthase [Synechococcales bacterium]
MSSDRIQKVLSQWGIASRRHAEVMIQAGRVQINGQTAQLGEKVDPAIDCIEVDGQVIQFSNRPPLTYLLLNKPMGVLSTCTDPQGRRTVLQLLPAELRSRQGIHPVGRLDSDSTGALILTNDGTLTQALTHPRYHIAKTYEVWVEGQPDVTVLQQWQQGVILEGQKTYPAGVKILQKRKDRTLLQVVLHEGRNRQIRKTAALLGHPVIALHRTAIGALSLTMPNHPNLALGDYRFLEESEVLSLKRELNLLSIRATTAVSKENWL